MSKNTLFVQKKSIPFAILIYLVYLTYCKICDRLLVYGYKDTDLASLTTGVLSSSIVYARLFGVSRCDVLRYDCFLCSGIKDTMVILETLFRAQTQKDMLLKQITD